MSGYDFFIAGFQRCGTSSLHYYLSQLDNIEMTNPKEDPFFFNKKNIKKRNDSIYGVSAPHFTIFPEAFETIYKTMPDIKIIILYRDPIERLRSACNFYINKFGVSENRFNNLTQKRTKEIDIKQLTNLDLQIERIANTSFYYKILEKITSEYKINIKNILLININDDDLKQKVLNFIGYKNNHVPDFKNNLYINSTKPGIFSSFMYVILFLIRCLKVLTPSIFLRQLEKISFINKLSDYVLFNANKWHAKNKNKEITLPPNLIRGLEEDYKLFKKKYLNV